MKQLNINSHKILGSRYFNRLTIDRDLIQDAMAPINDMYWGYYIEYIGERAINMLHLECVDYKCLININIKPFKKD
jgi:hypothetical protein